ncbi:nicotinamide-nucleotide adenylyltransferase [Sulfodiicoccus acidiphilus]|uniref:nicotinamide-nucleotide adenylyltransferase n=1 Tax=Sulfodiicoccus acidiphilus TaxID=1670455 RepID=UPI003B8A6962
MVKWALDRVDELVVLVGSAQESHTLSNPFTAGERIEMIRMGLKEYGLDERTIVVPISDVLMNSVWVYHVKIHVPKFGKVFARNPLVLRLFKEAGYEVEMPPLYNREKYNSTIIRKYIIVGENWSELVPKSVHRYIVEEIHGDERLKDIAGSDK